MIPEKSFHHLQPRSACWGKVNIEPFIPFKPVLDFMIFARGIVVADDVNFFTGCDATLDEVKKFNPLLMPVFTHTGSDHRAIHYIERCKE